MQPLKVAVIYHFWPHYREPLMCAMDANKQIDYDFFGSGEAMEGILHANPTAVARFVKAPYRISGRMVWQSKAVKAAICGDYDALIFLANPNFMSTWAAALVARLRGKPVLFWGHGWLRPEGFLKTLVRKVYFALSRRFLVYSERGKRMGVASGFPADKITVIYNSLDVEKADLIIARIERGELETIIPQSMFVEQNRPLIICTARLTAKCQFNLLLDAAAILSSRSMPINVLLVGDGPARIQLQEQATQLGLAVHFFGACYDEEMTGQLIYHSDITVSPGKIGLTAIHSLMYGTPAITHDDLDEQMPEVEAIVAGETGAFFARGNATSLADTIERWLITAPPRRQIRDAARQEIRFRWTPQVQAKIIETSVLQVTGCA